MTDLSALERVLGEATPGEWFSSRYSGATCSQVWTGEPGPNAVLICGDGDAEDANADFIALAHNEMPNLLALARRAEKDREDAERWRAFIGSERFKMMGAAGFLSDGEDTFKPNPERKGWLHFGIEVWNKHPAQGDQQDTQGRALLSAYVEHERAARALIAPAGGDR